ncbi:Anthranilate synthase aminase component [Patulibacter medicamentivorans]|uniref:Anthranilate synthase component 1 n=1 Tax=Patulibacter medicamentivorans TaxID=1097667 RepID=H0E1U5_9ACTN|nr:anthranilate synthase component I [Patulibacter medicamentivorans]EHN12337.1 Anthranilate synthase aminase component [Patulibacter medicamentivorans]
MPAAADASAALARAAALGLRITPTLDEVRALAADNDVVPVLARTIDDTETAVSAFLKLRAAHPGEPAFLLESADQGRVGRYSFLGVQPARTISWRLGDPGDPYAIARDAVGRRRVAEVEGLPPFVGGAVGVFAYDLVRTVEPLAEPNPDELGTPDLALMVTDAMVVFDHLQHTVTLLAPVHVEAGEDPDPAHPDELERRYAEAVDRIVGLRRVLQGPAPAPAPVHGPRAAADWRSNHTREQFEAMVARIIEYVHAGDAFQVVPSQRWSARVDLDPFSVYRGLRVVNPSPYMYYLDFGDWQVVGASPEPLVTVRGREISMRPIAGTRPRGATPAEDAELAEGMLADEKERAEHVMLVDLSRNDLGRVCDYGTVSVDELMVVETYSHVLHIVSAVSGTLREAVAATDALRSVLPAGTLSGAPKVRAMQIIDELEPVKRGGYGGAVGYLSWSGDLDSCIHIRTAVFKDGVAHVQAGGGTVADARPDYEYEESVNKSRAIRRAVEVALEQPDWS